MADRDDRTVSERLETVERELADISERLDAVLTPVLDVTNLTTIPDVKVD